MPFGRAHRQAHALQDARAQGLGDYFEATRIARWPVSARTRVRGADRKVCWIPFGTRHARAVGSGWTLCGISAVEWHYFWTIPFEAAHVRACAGCARRLEEIDPDAGA